MKLPSGLLEDIKSGRVLLFLGAGASAGALDDQGGGPPLGEDLRNRIVDKFLSPSFRKRSLAVAAELAISERDLNEVQEFVASQFKKLKPADFHEELTTFKWRAIATTNYDQVLEKAYHSNSSRAAQSPVVILSNEDRVDEKIRSDDHVAILKLHGCVTVTQRKDLPLILTVEQYVTHKHNRDYVFQRFEGWAREYPVVFVGTRLEDSNIREILLRLTNSRLSRPRYFLVSPDLSDVEIRFWEGNRVTGLPGTLQEFVGELTTQVPEAVRPLITRVPSSDPIRRKFVGDVDVPPNVEALLRTDVEYVHAGMPSGDGEPSAFYRGFGLGWYPIREGLDVRRRLTDTLLTDVIARPDEDRPSVSDFYVVKAAAGTGKSVLLRRVAWEAATQADALSLWVRPYGEPSSDDLMELHRLTGRRLFLHWENAASHIGPMIRLLSFARSKRLPLTVISAERVNEWNMSCSDLSQFVSDDFQLHRLSETEIDVLVTLLESHGCLGPNLRDKSHAERVDEFVRVADRHLLVALHEATMGPPFADILQNEFEKLRPQKAKQLYLTVCVLHRLRTPVRAGLISRVHDIPFEAFREQLFSPLEHVVEVQTHHRSGDHMYTARHPEIAQIVFTRMLSDKDDRLNEYLRIIHKLNLSFDTDRDSFRGLLRARALHDLFPDYQDVRTIFQKAEEVGGREPYFFQQRANYERIRPDGNYDDAEEFIRIARELDPRDETIKHTHAAILRAKAERADKPLVRQKHRDEARSILRELKSARPSDEYTRVTLVRIAIDELKEMMARDQVTDRELDETVRQVDRTITDALQQHPDEQYLHTAEADFSALIADDTRSLRALQRASKANPRDPFIANRLARALLRRQQPDLARGILKVALESSRGDMRLNFQYGEVLRVTGEPDPERLAYYFERAFTPGDRNYEAQFWYARFAFQVGDDRHQKKSREVFRALRNASMSHDRRVEVRDHLNDANGQVQVFQGALEQLEESYGRIRRDGLGDLVFVHSSQVRDDVWSIVNRGDRVCFAIGFCFNGPVATHLESLEL